MEIFGVPVIPAKVNGIKLLSTNGMKVTITDALGAQVFKGTVEFRDGVLTVTDPRTHGTAEVRASQSPESPRE